MNSRDFFMEILAMISCLKCRVKERFVEQSFMSTRPEITHGMDIPDSHGKIENILQGNTFTDMLRWFSSLIHLDQEKWLLFSRHFMKYIFLPENLYLFIAISLFFLMGPFYKKLTLIQIMAWHWIGNKSLFEPMMAWFTDAYMHHMASLS